MVPETVNLYHYYGLPAPEGAAGLLRCWTESVADPAAPRKKRPAVLILPGGGYAYTSPREAGPVALRFASGGYGAFVLEYSCAPARFPTALREAAWPCAFCGRMGRHLA